MGILRLIGDSLFYFRTRGAKTSAQNDQGAREINPHQQGDHAAKRTVEVVEIGHFPRVEDEKLLDAAKRESD